MMASRFLVVLGVVVGVFSISTVIEAQHPGQIYRIGLLDYGAAESGRLEWWAAFRERLRELGYIDGRNVTFEPRSAHGSRERLQTLAADLVSLKVDVIVTATGIASLVAKQATSTIPIVTATGPDPVGSGLVTSLARPGGNVTGLTSISVELSGKRLELIRTMVPQVSRIAVLWSETSTRTGRSPFVAESEDAARSLGVLVHPVGVREAEELDAAFRRMSRDAAGAVLIVPDGMLFTNRTRIATLAVNHRLPSVAASREYVEAGALSSYGTDFPDLFRRAAEYVDRILKGAKPGDLPVEQPRKFELAVNLKTAKALGLTLPDSLLVRADRVIR
jgi:putative ABC transport system substrate-binding protein